MGPTAAGSKRSTGSSRMKIFLILIVLLFLTLFLFIPLTSIFFYALRQGWSQYLAAITDTEALSAMALTCLLVAISVPLNIVFGITTSWSISKFEFKGKKLLTTLIELPLTVSPVISGTIFILLLGSQSIIGGFLESHQLKIIFAIPGIVLATLFITIPFIARELIPLMQSQGIADEEAAITLGASGWQTFWRITLPNIRWGLFYGIILCTARTIGEFGAVSVVSGHIRGKTITMPLEVEILYNEYNFTAAFAMASLLTLISLVALAIKKAISVKSISNDAAVNIQQDEEILEYGHPR
jgi:sulfate transport system permease protein